MPLPPAGLAGTARGTLTPFGVMTPAEAAAQAALAEVMSRAGAAQSAAGAAEAAFTQAAAEPAPTVDPMAAFLAPLLGGIASVIGGEPQVGERIRQQPQQSLAAALKARQENLDALRDVFKQRADAASRLGDLEAESKLRLKIAQMDKESGELRQRMAIQGRLDEQKLEGEQRLEQIRATQAAITGRAQRMTGGERRALIEASEGIDPETGFTDKAWYSRELALQQRNAARPTTVEGEIAAVNGISALVSRRLNDDATPEVMRARMAAINHPFAAKRVRGGRKAVFEPLFDDATIAKILVGNFGREAVAAAGIDPDTGVRPGAPRQQTPAEREAGNKALKEARKKALAAARKLDEESLRSIISNFPSLDQDDDIERVVRAARARAARDSLRK